MRYSEALTLRSQLGRIERLHGQSFAGITGTMAAGLAANAAMFAARYPAAAPGFYFPAWIHVHYTCLGTFTTPVTAGRRLGLRRGAGADPAGGASIEVVRDVAAPVGEADAGSTTETILTGKVATTAALTMTGITLETETRARISLAHAGTSGQDYDELWKLDGFALAPGELFAIVAGQAFDAVGTWQASVKGWGFSLW